LQELQAKFADVGFSYTEDDLSQPIDNLPNVGPTSADWLLDADIKTITDLERLGSVAAYKLVKQKHPRATLNLLWALETGLLGTDWRELSEKQRGLLNDELTGQ
jgi:hypothetical protein